MQIFKYCFSGKNSLYFYVDHF